MSIFRSNVLQRWTPLMLDFIIFGLDSGHTSLTYEPECNSSYFTCNRSVDGG